jgi:hypothetical protein
VTNVTSGPEANPDAAARRRPGANPEVTGGGTGGGGDECHVDSEIGSTATLVLRGNPDRFILSGGTLPHNPIRKTIMATDRNSSIRVESRSIDTDGSEVAVTRTISNIYDIRWDVKAVNWASVYVHSDTVRVGFGSLGGVDMTHDTAVKVFEDLKTALTNEGLLETESVV